MADNEAVFEFGDLPGVTFTAVRGSGGESGLPSNWISVTATQPADDPEHDPIIVCQVGFAGP